MTEYVIEIGNYGLQTWWQVSAVISLIVLYIVLNVIPAVMVFIKCIAEKDMFFEAPLFCLLILAPILGTIIGAAVWDENKWVYRIMVLMFYLFLISVIGIGIEK